MWYHTRPVLTVIEGRAGGRLRGIDIGAIPSSQREQTLHRYSKRGRACGGKHSDANALTGGCRCPVLPPSQ